MGQLRAGTGGGIMDSDCSLRKGWAMPEMTGSGGRGASGRSYGVRPDVEPLVAQGQRLVDGPRPTGDEALAWHVQAYLLGDFTAIVAAALRAQPPH